MRSGPPTISASQSRGCTSTRANSAHAGLAQAQRPACDLSLDEVDSRLTVCWVGRKSLAADSARVPRFVSERCRYREQRNEHERAEARLARLPDRRRIRAGEGRDSLPKVLGPRVRTFAPAPALRRRRVTRRGHASKPSKLSATAARTHRIRRAQRGPFKTRVGLGRPVEARAPGGPTPRTSERASAAYSAHVSWGDSGS